MTKKFWKTKSLVEFTPEEWEAVCCRCGKCCLIKLQDEDSDEIYYTDIVCRYFNHDNCCCSCYEDRCKLVPECLKLNINNVDKIQWMPQDCAYRILYTTGRLPDWHPLLTGQPLADKHSIKGRCISELLVNEEDFEDHILEGEEP